MKSPMNQTAEGLGEVMQLISAIVVSVLFAVLGLLVSKYFFIGIPVACLIIFILMPIISTGKRLAADREKHEMRERIRNIRR